MKVFRVVVVCAAALLVVAAPGRAEEVVTIEVDVVQPLWSNGSGPDYVGDFQAYGGIADEGLAALYTRYSLRLGLDGARGAIQIDFDADGWRVAGGSGAYENLQGGGSVSTEWYFEPHPWMPGLLVQGVRMRLVGSVGFVENTPPVAHLVVDSVSGMTVVLSAEGSADPDGFIASYEWDVNGDGVFDLWSIDARIQFTYGTAGNYEVAVRVTDDRGATDTASSSVTVSAPESPPDDGKGGGKGKPGKDKKKAGR